MRHERPPLLVYSGQTGGCQGPQKIRPPELGIWLPRTRPNQGAAAPPAPPHPARGLCCPVTRFQPASGLRGAGADPTPPACSPTPSRCFVKISTTVVPGAAFISRTVARPGCGANPSRVEMPTQAPSAPRPPHSQDTGPLLRFLGVDIWPVSAPAGQGRVPLVPATALTLGVCTRWALGPCRCPSWGGAQERGPRRAGQGMGATRAWRPA